VFIVAVEAVDIVSDERHAEPDVLAVQVIGDRRYLYLNLNR